MANLIQASEINAAAQRLWANPEVVVKRCMQIQQIAAPTGCEAKRASWVLDALRNMGFAGVEQDAQHNVSVRIPGVGGGGGVLVSAHLDTVFAADTDLRLRREPNDGRIFGPGIGDNSVGVAALISLAEALKELPQPPVDIWIAANSCEEGLGDLRGMRALCDRLASKVGACIVIEGMGLGRLVHRALGSQRFRIGVDAPGGHSWSDYGTSSAVNVLVQIAHDLLRIPVPTSPRTTLNLGRIQGGISVNTIAQHAELELDLRSEDAHELSSIVRRVKEVIGHYRSAEWQQKSVQISLTPIGDRPAGEMPIDHPLAGKAIAALREAGYAKYPDFRISSTDANIPLSHGIPAICIGITEGGNAHRQEEWIRVDPMTTGMRQLLLLTWATAEWLAKETA